MTIELSSLVSILSILRFEDCELWVYSHENYWIANEDESIGHLFEDYKKAFTTFTLYYN